MPLYEFSCRVCKAREDVVRSIKEPGDVPVPSCLTCETPMLRDYRSIQIQPMPYVWREDMMMRHLDHIDVVREDMKSYEKSWEPAPDDGQIEGMESVEGEDVQDELFS